MFHSLETQIICTDTELENSVRQKQWNALLNDLIENLVIKTEGGDSISSNKESPPQKNIIITK